MKNELNMDVKITNADVECVRAVSLGYWYGSKFAVASEVVSIAAEVSRGTALMTALCGRLAAREAHLAGYRTWERAHPADVKRYENEAHLLVRYVTAAKTMNKYDAMVKWAIETIANGERRESQFSTTLRMARGV